MTPTNRYLCPLDCGWHLDPRALPDLAGLSGNSIEDIISSGIERQAQAEETVIREHLETHSLVEWVTEVARLQRELNRTLATGGILSDSVVWGEGGPDCDMLPVRPRQRPEAVQRRVRDLLGRPPVMAVELMRLPTTPDGPTVTGGFDTDIEVPELDAEGMPLRTPATPPWVPCPASISGGCLHLTQGFEHCDEECEVAPQ